MNVLILTPYHRLGPRVEREVLSLREAGYTVKVLGWDRTGEQTGAESDEDEAWVSLRAPLGKLRVLFYLPRLYWAIAQKVRLWNVDIIHCTHLLLLPLSIFLARSKHTAVVYDVYERHSLDIASHFGLLKRPAKGFIEFIEDRMLVPRVQGVMTVDSPAAHLETRYRKRNQNTVMLNNVPSLVFTGDQHDPAPLCDWLIDKRILVWVGSLSVDKGLFTCIDVMSALVELFPEVGLLLVGEFDDANTEIRAFSLIERYGMKEHVYVVPWLPYQEMLSYCRRAEVALALYQPDERFLFVGKGTGRKFFTYMECGLPIVATDFAEVAMVVKEEECGLLVDTTDSNAIVEAIAYLLEHPETAKEMGMQGRRAIEEKYNWEIESTKLLQVYDQVRKHLDHRSSTLETR